MPTRPERVDQVSLASRGSFWVLRGLEESDLAEILAAHREKAKHGWWIKNNRGSLVTLVSTESRGLSSRLDGVSEVVVKEARLAWRRRLAHRFGTVSRFCRDFAVADRLEAMSIATPGVVAASHRPVGPCEYEVTAYIPESRTLRECLWLGERTLETESERTELLRRAGGWLRRAHDAGLWQRDLKPNNILVRTESRGPDEGIELFLLDVTAVRFFAGPLGEDQRARNLSQLLDLPAALDAEAVPALLSGYTGGDEDGMRRLENRVREDVRARRDRRRARTGFLYVDEEHFGYGERP